MDPLGAVCSMTNPSQSNQISMTNFARSQQKKLRKICGKFNFFCGISNPTILAFRMYASTLIFLPGCYMNKKVVKKFNDALDCIEKILNTVDALALREEPADAIVLGFIYKVKEDFTAIK